MDISSKDNGTLGSPPADDDRAYAMFEFPGVSPCISKNQQREFEEAFCGQIGTVKKWFIDNGWISKDTELLPLPISGTYLPSKKFHVFVSPAYQFSRALVPAWSTQRGWMEFPAYRVVAAEAAVAHELVHVFFPNANRFLAEGLAVYLQHRVGNNPSFPNFNMDLHQLVLRLLETNAGPFTGVEDLGKISIINLDKIPTPDELTFRIDQADCDDPSITYALAGSFVQFLIENCEPPSDGTSDKCRTFFKLYSETPLVPLVRDPGCPRRWERVYKRTLAVLEAEWREFVLNLLHHAI